MHFSEGPWRDLPRSRGFWGKAYYGKGTKISLVRGSYLGVK